MTYFKTFSAFVQQLSGVVRRNNSTQRIKNARERRVCLAVESNEINYRTSDRVGIVAIVAIVVEDISGL